MGGDKFDKEYAYNVRHNYGKEGKRTVSLFCSNMQLAESVPSMNLISFNSVIFRPNGQSPLHTCTSLCLLCLCSLHVVTDAPGTYSSSVHLEQEYTPHSCMKIIMATPGVGDQHGCPYRHFRLNIANLVLSLPCNLAMGYR